MALLLEPCVLSLCFDPNRMGQFALRDLNCHEFFYRKKRFYAQLKSALVPRLRAKMEALLSGKLPDRSHGQQAPYYGRGSSSDCTCAALTQPTIGQPCHRRGGMDPPRQ